MQKRILFVDDESRALDSLRSELQGHTNAWAVTFENHAQTAWERLLETDFDAVVVDIKTPLTDGFELLQRIRKTQQTRDVPVVIVTGLLDRSLKAQALSLGATDLLNRPIATEDLVARLANVLRLKSYQDELKYQNYILEQTVLERTNQLAASRLGMIWRLSKVAEFRDEVTGHHVVRVACYCRALAESLGMDREFVETLFLASPLHDIGKIGISDSILRKSGQLTFDEWEIMRQHCVIGQRILLEDDRIVRLFHDGMRTADEYPPRKVNDPVLRMAAVIALGHHEKWDGSGYPHGLTGEKIPSVARIVALADAYDALTTERPYKPALSLDQASSVIRNDAGKHFDPKVCRAFETSLEQFKAIRTDLADNVDTACHTQLVFGQEQEPGTERTGILSSTELIAPGGLRALR